MKKVLIAGIIIFLIFLISTFFEESEETFFSNKIFAIKPKELNMLFVGDIFFDRYIRKVMDNKGEDYIFSCINEFLNEHDVVVGNLEGPITDFASLSLGSEIGSPNNFVFTFPPKSASLLYKNNIKIVNLGNNHIGNFGKEGFASTKKYLNDSKVEFFGGYYGDESVLRKEIKGNKISLISFNEFGGEKAEKVAEKIKEEKRDGRIVFVYAHWGDEYVSPPHRIRNYAKIFAESGADFVIGSHPHVILESERLGETFVYYSLGNFLFDQYWNEQVRTGLALEIKIKGEQIEILEHKTNLEKDGRVCLIQN
jgi:gamma-polyglutamate biosynthesis protein CapA